MKILVADDSAVLRAAVTKLLEPQGYEVVVAEDGVDAITKFYEETPDLVLLDVQMPKLNGYVVCRLIKEDPAAAQIPVLILTVRTSAEDRYWGVKSGADGYLTKDSIGDELIKAVQASLASRALRELTGQELTPPAIAEGDVLTRVCEMLDRKLFEATVVNEITSVATRPVGLYGTIDEILTSVERLVHTDAAGIVLSEEGRCDVRCAKPMASEDRVAFHDLAAEHLREMATANNPVPAHLDINVRSDADGDDPGPARGWSSFHSVPLRSRGELIGILVLGSHTPGAFTPAVHRTLRAVTPSIVSVLESARDFQSKLADEAKAMFSGLG